ncbi:cyclic nucleotide-binding protein [Massilia sp. Root351]|uniref:DUF1003 domain-containing protein n=1 Tax=Massilia sp. Root351 TaxID=1736522 RepID=UPI00070A4837|nr:DUF1003 domain-containing protein [Massilia sp. Root351]KQV82298.1 cyclic nucleotide-binding protein [Massilia sp. Root351]
MPAVSSPPVPPSAAEPSQAELDAACKRVARQLAARQHVSRNLAQEGDQQATRGQKAADAVAAFGGSWTFIGLFMATLLAWVVLNSVILVRHGKPFDPYPYILLNLFLSMLASVQAPIILMSQNRQAQKDRMTVEHDYEVNLKAEVEILLLHEKLDHLREEQWRELVAMQQKQIDMLTRICEQRAAEE